MGRKIDRERPGKVDRLLRVNELVKRELAGLLERYPVPELSGVLVSVTEVSCSVDLRNAAVFVSVYGGFQIRFVTRGAVKRGAYLRYFVVSYAVFVRGTAGEHSPRERVRTAVVGVLFLVRMVGVVNSFRAG